MRVFKVQNGVAVVLTAEEAAGFRDAPGYPRPVHDLAEFAVAELLGKSPEMAPAFAEKVRAGGDEIVVSRDDVEALVSGLEHGYDNRFPSDPEFQAAIRLREALGGTSPLAYMKKE